MNEHWKDISGYEGEYMVSDAGNVRSTSEGQHHGKILGKRLNANGYSRVSLSSCGIVHDFLTHRLVAQAFIDNPYDKDFINHINGIHDDNRVSNIEWCTKSENAIHAYETGLHRKLYGKLDESDVLSIHALAIYYSYRDVGMMFGVGSSTVYSIVNGRNFTHVIE